MDSWGDMGVEHSGWRVCVFGMQDGINVLRVAG